MITLTNVNKRFGRHHVLRNVSLTIASGELVAITGKSGSGKSTLLNILGLIEAFDSGEYVIDDYRNIKPNSRQAAKLIRNEISYIFQNFALIDDATVDQNLQYAQRYLSLSKAQQAEQRESVLDTVGLSTFHDHKIYELSGGQQQRVAIARCMIKPSHLILADEPTGSLDATNRDAILQLLIDLNHSGKTVVVVTHDSIVAHACQRVIAMDALMPDRQSETE